MRSVYEFVERFHVFTYTLAASTCSLLRFLMKKNWDLVRLRVDKDLWAHLINEFHLELSISLLVPLFVTNYLLFCFCLQAYPEYLITYKIVKSSAGESSP